MAQVPENDGGGCTNFEAMSHAQLLAMVKNAQPSVMTGRGDALNAAAKTLQEISDELHGHIGRLEWSGPASDAFRGWATQISTSTMQLGEYAGTAGSNIKTAGVTLAGVQGAGGIPPLPTADIATVNKRNAQPLTFLPDDQMKLHDFTWVSALDASAAQTRINNAHQEAIHQMTVLGQSYDLSTSQIGAATPPTFPPTPMAVMPPALGTVDQSVDVSFGGSSSGGSSGHPSSGTTGKSKIMVSPPGKGGEVPAPQPAPGHLLPIAPGPIGSHPTPGPIPPVTGTVTSVPPASTGIDSGPVAPTLPPLPTKSAPVGSVPAPGSINGSGSGSVGGGYLGVVGGLGGTNSYGSGGYAGGRVPIGSVNGGLGGGATAGDEGISGGLSRPVGPSGRSQLGTNVFGAEEAGGAGASGGMPGGMGGRMSGGVGGSGSPGSIAGRGRGLTSTEGGEIGGSHGPEVGGEFTPGGTGLRARSAGDSEVAERTPGSSGYPLGGAHGAGKKNKDRRNRAAYLVEDEETWTAGTPVSNPNVIE